MSEKEQTKPNLTVISNKEREQAEKHLNSKVDSETLNMIKNSIATDVANQIMTKMDSHILNNSIRELKEEVVGLKNIFAETANELKKQTVGDRNCALKVGRNQNNPNAIEVKSLNRHLDSYIVAGHVAELFKIMTTKGDKYSSGKASNMLSDLQIKQNPNFSYVDITSKTGRTRKYTRDVFAEIIDRLNNPEYFGIVKSIAERWTSEIIIPTNQEIEIYKSKIIENLEKY